MSEWSDETLGVSNETLTRLMVKIRGKDETIVSLKSENAMLRLKLAQLRASLNTTRLQKDNMRRQFLYAQSNLNCTVRELSQCQKTIQSLRADIEEMRTSVKAFPSMATIAIEASHHSLADLEKEVLKKSDAITASLKQQLSASKDEHARLQELYSLEKKRRKELHNTIVELRGNIRVHCRVRPMLPFDRRSSTDANSGGSTPRSGRGQAEEVVSLLDDETVSVHTLRQQLSGVGMTTKHFDFDHVYGPGDDQGTVFAEVQPLLTSLLDGYNVCLMAYGQTGSGKTHSMLGDGLESGVSSSDIWWHQADTSPGKYPHQCHDHGIIPRAAVEIFRLIEERSSDCQVSIDVSVVEIYNNEVYDLLKETSSKCDVAIKEDGSVDIVGVTRRDASNSQEVMKYVLLGLQRRAESATGVHQHSSRSHLIITLNLCTTNSDKSNLLESAEASAQSTHPRVKRSLSFDQEPEMRSHTPVQECRPPSPRRSPPVSPYTPRQQKTTTRSQSLPWTSPNTTPRRQTSTPIRSSGVYSPGVEAKKQEHGAGCVSTKLQLVDLAGSECAALSGVVGTGMREASFINKSLSSLADVLCALAKKQQHVPYRNSKLTHVLQDTIGGNAKMLVLTCVAPAQRYATESVQCLQFGSRIRQVQRGPVQRNKSTIPLHGSRV